MNLIGFALLASGVAFIFYFRLIAEFGPSRALTVTFLMPVFGMLLGTWILHEPITISMAVGCALTLSGVYLVLKN